MRLKNFIREELSTGGIGEATRKRDTRIRRCRVNLEQAFIAGQNAAKRGGKQSRDNCNYSDPQKVEAWLKGYDSVKR